MYSKKLFHLFRCHPRRVSFALLLFIVLVTIAQSLDAQEVVRHRFSSQDPSQDWEDLLFLSAGIELTKAGLTSTRDDRNTEYELVTEYAISGNTINLHYTFFKAGIERQQLAEAALQSEVDFSIDSLIAEAVRRLLEDAAVESKDVAGAEISGLFVQSAPPVDETGQSARPKEAGEDSQPIEPVAQDIGSPETAQESVVRFDIALSPGFLVLFGDLTEYFHYGGGGTVTLGPSWSGTGLRLGFGFKGSFSGLFNDEGVTGGTLYLSTVGMHVLAGSGIGLPYRFSLQASGGAALITVAREAEAMTKAVPYADAGLQIDLPLGDGFRLGGGLAFLMVFDSDILIMALSPVLTLGVEL